MKLGIIFTGGTIGCQVAEDGYLQLPDSSTYFLLEGAKKPSFPLNRFACSVSR